MANESALKDGNRVPTMLFESGGETKRVSPANPLPINDVGMAFNLKTKTMERTVNDGLTTLITPAAGKKITVKGVTICHEPASGGDSVVRFQSGKIIHKVYRADQSGNFISMNSEGAVDEPVQIQIANAGGGNRAFFLVNYVEA